MIPCSVRKRFLITSELIFGLNIFMNLIFNADLSNERTAAMRQCIRLLGLILIVLLVSCSDKDEPNRVPLDQFNIDNSNDYRYIFRKTIQKEHWEENRYKKDEFQE